MVIDRPSLDPNPFDGTPADPIALVCAPLTNLTGAVARNLRRQLPLTAPPDSTVRWHTPGLDPAVAANRARTRAIERREHHWNQDVWQPDIRGDLVRVDRVGGVLTMIAPPEQLRSWAVHTARLGDWWHNGMDYTDLDSTRDGGHRRDGEVQIFRDYRQRVGAAQVACREILARKCRQLPPADLNPVIWDHLDTVRARNTRPPRSAPNRSEQKSGLAEDF